MRNSLKIAASALLLSSCGGTAAPPSSSPPIPSTSPIASSKPAASPAASASGVESPAGQPIIRPALSTPFVYGVAAGDMTSDSAILWTRLSGAGRATAELAESEAFDRPISLPPVQAPAAHDFTVKVEAKDLKPSTAYFYRFKSDGATSPVGRFKTAYAPDYRGGIAMAFTGDAHWSWKPYPLLNSLLKEKLDYFLFLGDLIYEDTGRTTSAEDLEGYRFKYRENREPRDSSESKMVPMRDLYSAFGMYAIFDNHETGASRNKDAPPYTEGGASASGQFVNQTPGFKQRAQALLEYQPFREETVSGTGDPRLDGTTRFYRAVPWGASSELIVLDDRSYRDQALVDPDTPQALDC